MSLLGVEVVLVSYVGIRLYEKYYASQKITILDNPIQKTDASVEIIKKPSKPFKVVVDDNEREKHLHYVQASGVSLGFAGLTLFSPVFYFPMVLSFTYASVPYLRLVENSLFKKKKIDGYVLYGVADFMALGLGQNIAASFAMGLHHFAHFVIANAKKDSKQSIINIFAKQPNKIWVLRNDVEVEINLAEVKTGDVVVIHSGDLVPVDGVITKGNAVVDQHTLTGESQPVEKTEGDNVYASTQIMGGQLHIQVSTSGNETTAAKIAEILNHSIDSKTHAQLKGEQWADSWNLPVLGLALASMPLLGPVGTAVILNGHIAQSIRVVAPLSTLNYLNIAAHKGILIKDGHALENLYNIDTFLFDKTGTLTSEEPEVGGIVIFQEDYTEKDILYYAAAAECKLQHPIARAIINRAMAMDINLPEINDMDYILGYGVTVQIEGKLIQVGSHRFIIKEEVSLPDNYHEKMQHANALGHSLVMLAIDKQLVGMLEMHAAVRSEVRTLLTMLRQHGAKQLIIVSGDRQPPTEKLANTLGMDTYFYDILPQDKAEIVKKLQAEGRKVCFIGDGVNDTLAMKQADISISLQGATSVATDTAQIVLMDGSLSRLPELITISQELKQNLHNSWLYNIVPGALTVICAYTLRIDIITAVLLNQGGLALGIINAMLPLRQINEKEKQQLTNSPTTVAQSEKIQQQPSLQHQNEVVPTPVS